MVEAEDWVVVEVDEEEDDEVDWVVDWVEVVEAVVWEEVEDWEEEVEGSPSNWALPPPARSSATRHAARRFIAALVVKVLVRLQASRTVAVPMPDLPELVDLHIRLRQRIAAVLHARQHWAQLLKDALHTPQVPGDNPFIAPAYDALAAIESPCNIIFDYPLPVPPCISRPAPRQKQISTRPSAPSFLYIKSSALGHTKDPDELYLLKCPQCLRTAFTTLQGLLNHARIAHHLEWGTHEECVRACAVVDPDLDTSAGVQVGIGPSGILPGLRSIFQMAVTNQSSDHVYNEQPDRATKMLGLHQDTAALAPFLGKNPVRRGIKVYGQDDTIDVDGLHTGHRLPLCSRNARRIHEWEQELQVNDVSASQENVPAFTHPSTSTTALVDSTRSRFHFNTRIVVTDRSFWIPPSAYSPRH